VDAGSREENASNKNLGRSQHFGLTSADDLRSARATRANHAAGTKS
jgi:hypothetical protein